MRLAVYCDGNFVVTAPRYMSMGIIERFIMSKAEWVLGKLEYFKSVSGQVFVRGTKKEYGEHKARALNLAQERVEYFNQFYGFTYNRISIKNQKTRWGSCSRKGNLNFNYKIATLTPLLADYLIVHELCHLKEFNHSKRFWSLVAEQIIDYKLRRNELKRSGVRFG
ncbi:MAG: hypothetical protein UT05_C0002G0019 [Parcubacteria group bacterium GW2011_GWF2_38_76]|nr:MAG: hypothetical protein UT05_C0002G0019 [Parcubacteria group bacterium GW2011_GWF2_38_76]